MASEIEDLRRSFSSLYDSKGFTKIQKQKDQRKIVCISDLHLPFVCMDVLEIMMNRDAGADYLIINGDFLDCHCLSSFTKNKYISLLDEYNSALELLELFSQHFGKVILVAGNHDGARMDRIIGEKVPEGAQFLFRKSILERLAHGEILNAEGELTGKKPFKNVVAVTGPSNDRWYVRVGNTVFAHPSKGSKIEGKIAEYMLQHFRDRLEGIDSVVIGHVHKLSRHYAHGFLCIEGGCLCYPLEYSYHPSAKYSPQPMGYSVIVQDLNGNTDYSLSHEVFCGVIKSNKELSINEY